jgi:hypothetical protein
MNMGRTRIAWACAALGFAAAHFVPLPGSGWASGEGWRKEELDLPYDAKGEPEEEEEAPELIVFYAEVYEADGFFYFIDRSLSMADGEWEILKGELTRNLREFSERVEFGMVFSSRDTVVFPSDEKPAVATRANKAAATAKLETLEPESWTCLEEGLHAVLRMASRATSARKAIILLSDGKPTCPGTDFITYRRKILEDALILNTEHIPIHTIGVGADVDESFLRSIADSSGGRYRRIRH